MKIFTAALSEESWNLVWRLLMDRSAKEAYTTIKDLELQLAAQGAFTPPPTVDVVIAAELAKRTPPTETPNDPATHPETFIETNDDGTPKT